MLDAIFSDIKVFDADLTAILNQFFKRFAPFNVLPFFAAHFADFTKIMIYSLFTITPLLFVKVLYPYKKIFSYLILLLLALIGFCLIGIFLGFVQLLYS